MLNAFRRFWILLLPAILLAGCPKGGLGGLNLDAFMPKVTFKRLAVKDVDFQHIETDFVFNVSNPNPIRVALASFSYRLNLSGNQLIAGDKADGFALEARGDSKLVFPVSIKFKDIIQLVGDVNGQDNVPFKFKGTFGFNTPLGKIELPFTESGQFPVVQAPKVAFKRISVGKLDLLRQTATISVDLGVTHKGGSAIELSGFDYGLKLGGRQIAEGLISTVGNVAAGQEREVSIPVTLNLLQVGATIVDAVTRKTKLVAELDANLNVGTPFGIIPLHIDEKGKVEVL